MRIRTSLVLAALTIFVSSIVLAQPAGALDLYKITGHVTDAIGRPLAGVTVRNGGQVTTTNASGDYSLGQSSTGTFTLRASRADLDTDTKTVTVLLPLDTPVNFNMLYRIAGVVSPAAISTAAPGAEATLDVSSWAPSPGIDGSSGTSCVSVMSTLTGQEWPAEHVGANPDGSSRWTFVEALPQHTIEAPYELRPTASDCSSHVALSAPALASYLVDNRGPGVDVGRVLPVEGGNTVVFPAQSQPLQIGLTEETSGVDPSSAVVTLHDDTLGTSVAYTGTAVSYDAALKSLRTASVSSELVVGHRYHTEVSVADTAGNVTLWSQSEDAFLAISADTTSSPVSASILRTPCELTGTNDLVGNQQVRCRNVFVHLSSGAVTMSGVRSPGTGVIGRSVEVTHARLGATVAGVAVENVGTMSAAPSKSIYMPFSATAPSQTSATYVVPSLELIVGDVYGTIPPGTTSPVLSMSSDPTGAVQVTCPDPTATTQPCSPDPLSLSGHTPRTRSSAETTLVHYGKCDAAVTSKPPAAIYTGSNLALPIDVDTSLVLPQTASVSYAINGQWAASPIAVPLDGSGNGAGTIPSATLPAGTTLSIVTAIHGQALNIPGCEGVADYVSPANSSYEIAVVDQGADAETKVAAVSTALQGIGREPELAKANSGMTMTGVCARFSSPTPCDLLPASSELVEHTPLAGAWDGTTPVPEIDVGGDGGSPPSRSSAVSSAAACNYWFLNNGQGFSATLTGQSHEGGAGAVTRNRANADTRGGTTAQYGRVYLYEMTSQSGAGHAWSQGTITGWRSFRWLGATASYAVDLSSYLRAYEKSAATSGVSPTFFSSNVWGKAEGWVDLVYYDYQTGTGFGIPGTRTNLRGTYSDDKLFASTHEGTEDVTSQISWKRNLSYNGSYAFGVRSYLKTTADASWDSGGGSGGATFDMDKVGERQLFTPSMTIWSSGCSAYQYARST